MTTITGTPTMSQERFTLSHDGSDVRKPWSRSLAVLAALARPSWTERDRARLERVSERLDREDSHTCARDVNDYFRDDWNKPCQACEMTDLIDRQVKEWDRIAQAPPIPSTAQLRNALRRPDRAVRAARMYRDLMERLDARKRDVLAGLRQYKTPSVRRKHEQAAEDNDPGLRRINRAIWRLEKIRPDARHLARTLR